MNLPTPPRVRQERIALFFLLLASALSVFPQRVVSMAPAITEIVFALGKGDTLVGVTKFCDYPPPAAQVRKIGGLLDVSLETLMMLAPEIILTYPEQYARVKFLEPRVRVLAVQHRTLSDLFASVHAIGAELRSEKSAIRLVAAMQNELAAIAAGARGRRKIRALIIAGRNADELKNMYIVGKDDFLNDLLEIAGGVNAYQGEVYYPNISLEAVIAMNPDVILEISAHVEGIAAEKVLALWRPFKMLRAVRRRQIRIIKQSFWLRPGTRVGLIAGEMARIFDQADATDDPAVGN